MGFFAYLVEEWPRLLDLAIQHVYITAIPVLIGTVIAVLVGIATYRTRAAGGGRLVRVSRIWALGIAGVFLTIPSFALFGLFIPILGLGAAPVIAALVMYSLLPVLRNTITGLQEVDGSVIESARGMGMSRWQQLTKIELPLAWPVIIAGMRVSTLLIIGIAAIGAFVNGPGLGQPIFDGLSRLGGAGALNSVLAGTLGIVVLALLFDLFFVGITKLTTSRGIQ